MRLAPRGAVGSSSSSQVYPQSCLQGHFLCLLSQDLINLLSLSPGLMSWNFSFISQELGGNLTRKSPGPRWGGASPQGGSGPVTPGPFCSSPMTKSPPSLGMAQPCSPILRQGFKLLALQRSRAHCLLSLLMGGTFSWESGNQNVVRKSLR